jgi:hypothetical protein
MISRGSARRSDCSVRNAGRVVTKTGVADYRIDIQYRGTTGVPPNAIQWRVIYGDADDLDVRDEPETAKRFASVFLLNPATICHWKFTWAATCAS